MTRIARLALLTLATGLAASAHAQLKPSPSVAPRPAAPAPAPAPAAAPAAQPGAKADAEKETAGRMAALGWLGLLDRRDWGTAWDSSATAFRQTVPLGNWMDAIPKVREPFGVLKEREPAETVYKTTMPGRPDGHYVSVNFVSRFDKMTVNEVVTTTLDTDGRWRVMGYTYTQR